MTELIEPEGNDSRGYPTATGCNNGLLWICVNPSGSENRLEVISRKERWGLLLNELLKKK